MVVVEVVNLVLVEKRDNMMVVVVVVLVMKVLVALMVSVEIA